MTRRGDVERAARDAAQRRQVGAAAERLADVFAERADVGALAAADVDRPAGRPRRRRRRIAWIVTRRARALDLDAGARVFVQRLAVVLQRRVHRRHLVDRAGEARRRPRQARRGRRRLGAVRTHVAFGVAGGRRHAQAQRRAGSLVGVEAAPARTWSRRRSRAAAGRSPAGRACRCGRPSRRDRGAWPSAARRCSKAQRLVEQQHAMHGAARRSSGAARRRFTAQSSLARVAFALAISAFSSAARSVVRSNLKCSVGTVWICRRLNRPLRRSRRPRSAPASHSLGSPTSSVKKPSRARSRA